MTIKRSAIIVLVITISSIGLLAFASGKNFAGNNAASKSLILENEGGIFHPFNLVSRFLCRPAV